MFQLELNEVVLRMFSGEVLTSDRCEGKAFLP